MQVNKLPKYQKIQQDIEEKISSGIYHEAAKLPSENQMAAYYQTSVPTVRKALQELVRQERIHRVKGSGTYVTRQRQNMESMEGGLGRNGGFYNICFMVFTDVSDSSVMKMIRGAQAALFAKGCNMSILCRDRDKISDIDIINRCHANGVDGIIYFAGEPENSANSFRLLHEYGIPTVMLDRAPQNYPHTLVAAYNVDGGYQMARFMLEKGHRRIVFLLGTAVFEGEKERLRGYEMALEEAGIEKDPNLIRCWWNPEGQERVLELVRNKEITAIQCVNDKIAAEVICRLQSEGISVPGDISVGGFDDWEEAMYMVPGITTIVQPFEEMGRVAAEKLVEILQGKCGCSQIYLPVKLKIRDSILPLNA